MSARILVVCTANVCRSPMAAAFLAHHVAAEGVVAHVRSAGTDARDLPVDPLAVEAMTEYGLDIGGHVPRRLSASLIDSDGADLVLTMTREHLRTVAITAHGSFRRTFTAKELVYRLAHSGVERGAGLVVSLAAVGEGRLARDLVGDHPDDDIADPYGLSLAMHRATAAELDQLMRSIAQHLG